MAWSDNKKTEVYWRLKMGTHDRFYRGVLLPALYYLKGDFRYWHLKGYIRNLSKSREEILAYRLERLGKLIRHAYGTVPYYRQLFDRLGLRPSDIRTTGDLKKVPILTKKKILENLDDLKSTKRRRLLECYSGGSTGNRVVVYKDRRYEHISRAVFMRDLYSAGVMPGDRAAWIWGSPVETGMLRDRLLRRLFWRLTRRIYFNPFVYTKDRLESWIRQDLARFRPEYIYGYPNAIYEAAKIIREKNIEVHTPKKIICSAMRLEKREFIEGAFNCQVLDQYGSREVLEIAIEDENYVMHSADDFVIVELGEGGEILLTPLESYGMPLIRYAIGDIGEAKPAIADDGHPFSQFNIRVGRSCETMKRRDGRRISPSKINLLIAKERLNIGEFQVVQESYDKVWLNLVRSGKGSEKDVRRLCRILKSELGCRDVVVRGLDRFPVEKSGKRIGYKCLIGEEAGQ